MADVLREQATEALRRGEAEMEKGDPARARAWFGRARRLVAADPAVAFALGNALLALHDPEAIALFAQAAAEADTGASWLGLCAAHWHAGAVDKATAALARALSTHVLPSPAAAIAGLADAVCASGGFAGWCGVAASGPDRRKRLVISPGPEPEIRVDGTRIAGPDLSSVGHLEVTRGGVALLGSPIDLTRLSRAEGVVEAAEGGLSGWIWLPSDVEADPVVTIGPIDAAGTMLPLRATDTGMTAPRPLARTRRFTVPAAVLAGAPGPVQVTGPDGSRLAGSPVDPRSTWRAAAAAARIAARTEPATGPAQETGLPDELPAPAAITGPPAAAPLAPDRPIAIVIPAYRGYDLMLACLASVFASGPADQSVIVVDDATPEPALATALDALARSGRITLIRHTANLGFPAAANAGLRAAFALVPDHDAVLLNSDTLTPARRTGLPAWWERLRAAVHAEPDTGTATPLSNDATILSYPHRDTPNPQPGAAVLARLDAQAARANAGLTVEIPTSVGFCMYVRRECALDTGLFRPALFAQGYGEENDFCIRARHLGWRHVAVPGVMVAHLGGASFGTARPALIRRNLAVLERLHPGYRALIAAYQGAVPAADPLAPARRRLDEGRWATARLPPAQRRAAVLVTHDNSGGVERMVRRQAQSLRAAGFRAILLRPILDPNSREGSFLPGLCRVEDGVADTPNLVYRLPDEMPALLRLLRADRPKLFEVHHRLGHHSSVMELADRLGLAPELHLHDYASFCPRISLLGPEHRYCGEPTDIAVCEACVADAGNRLEDGLSVAALRARSAAEFARARRIVVPSADMAARMRRHFPLVQPDIVPLEDDDAPGRLPPPPAIPPRPTLPRRVCVIGAIGLEKGFDVLLACARDAARRSLPLEFVLVGHSTDDRRLMDTGRIFVTGRYDEADGPALIRAQNAHLAFLPSIWPETWGFTLGLAWQAGLRAAVFDIGAMAARIRATGLGWTLPLGLPPAAINNALLNATQSPSLAGGQQDRLWTYASLT